jgi:hypothetical protein
MYFCKSLNNTPQDGLPQVNALQEGNYKDKDMILYIHREDRVHMLFLQSSELGLPHPLTRRRECVPPSFDCGGWGTHSLAGEGVEGPNSGEGKTLCIL